MAEPHLHPLSIGEWRVDPALDEIARNGNSVKLEPRAMRLLLCLAQQPGEVLSVDQLLEAVWKDVVVTPDSVYQAVAGLRRALGDGTKEPAYIATVLRRGYRLVAPVRPCEEAKTAVAPVPDSRQTPLQAKQWHRSATALLLSAALVLVGGYFYAQRAKDQEASVAVLPFVDLSETHDQEYFADGLTEELIDRLTTARGLQVAARSSSFYFKKRPATVADVARTLHVAYLLEGTVRKVGASLRVSTHLVRVSDGYDVWSKTYDRSVADIFEIQDEIASAVVHQFKMSVLMPTSFTSSHDARDEYLRAEAFVNHGTAADYDAAETHLRAALGFDPDFSEAWAWLAMTSIWKFDQRAASPTREACDDARAASTRALELGPASEQNHRAKGIVLRSCDGNLRGAESEFSRALQLQPEHSQALMSQAWLAVDLKQLDRALAFANHATIADPLNPWAFSTLCGVSLVAGHTREAEDACRRAVSIDPTAGLVHTNLAMVLLTNQQPEAAVEELDREPDPQYRLMLLPIALESAQRMNEAEIQLAQLKQRYGDQNGDWVALYYACHHDTANAIRWLQYYAERHEEILPYPPRLQACLDTLESDSRYRKLRQRLRFASRRE